MDGAVDDSTINVVVVIIIIITIIIFTKGNNTATYVLLGNFKSQNFN